MSNFYIWSAGHKNQWLMQSISDRIVRPMTIMYDQEPLHRSCTDIYRHYLCEHSEEQFINFMAGLDFVDIMACHRYYRNANIPIWCHSEKNSMEIDLVRSALYVDCYYWYHALISRDWFRHWQYFPKLEPRNKSHAPWRFLMYARDCSGTRTYRKQVLASLERFRSSICHDWAQTKNVSPDFSATIDVDDADKTAVHLVLETLFDTEKIYLTEKVFKPMVMSQPFLLWGPPGSLNLLRQYGFRTFDGMWSESYDMEADHDKRMDMILTIVEQLQNLSDEKFNRLYERCLPIIQHNRAWFFSSDFYHACWVELRHNLQAAIEQRQQLQIRYPGGQFCYVLGERNPALLETMSNRAVLKNFLRDLPECDRDRILQKYPSFRV